MTTIPQLLSASAVTDADLVPISQSGILRAASHAQLTAGLQPSLTLSASQLLGRASAGIGSPEPIAIGANLTLAGNTLSATAAPFTIAALPAAAAPSSTDLVSLSQVGANKQLNYAGFMAGLSSLANLDISQLAATPTGLATPRRVADQLADTLPIEAFGAVGDGITDDTASFVSALASNRPIRLASKTYAIAGQLTVSTANATLIGVPGQSIVKRIRQSSGSAFIAIQASGFHAEGVSFDANRTAFTTDNWSVLVSPACLQSDWHRCSFLNAGGSTLGSGLVILASDPSAGEHVIRDCEFANNQMHGIWVQACSGILIEACRAHDNGQYGINLDYNDNNLVKKIRLAQVIGNRCWNNLRGIAIGNFNATNATNPVWGNANPDALTTLVSGNLCHDNSIYGIAVSGRNLLVHGNLCSNNGTIANSGAAILANASYSRVTANMLTGAALYGIDSGGSINSDISANQVTGHSFGINCGGGTSNRVEGNTIQDASAWAILVNNVETDSNNINFGLATTNLALVGNWIAMNGAAASGILLRDGPQGVLVARNHFIGSNGAVLANCLWCNTDQVIIEGNRWNFTQRFFANPTTFNALQTVVMPDIADAVMITSAGSGVQSMLTSYQIISYGQVTFVRVTNGGAGYSTASVSISGPGTGATARAVLSLGTVIGIVVTVPGTGYGSAGAQLAVSITGDGSGATAVAYAGVPVPDERRLRVRCNTAVRFARAGSSPVQENWTATDITVAANADIEWTGTFNTWRASFFASSDYLLPDSSGGALMRSTGNADIQLRPAGNGRVRLTSDTETTGCLELIGRNAPETIVTAPPGSTYRNLNGGSGTSFYVKRSGTGTTGWFAIC
jgi:parallel beta-helix repeat protein